MTLTLADVRGALLPDEPRYQKIAAAFGADALPHLKSLIEQQSPLATKAAYLAGLIDDPAAVEVLRAASASPRADVRVSAAFAAHHSPIAAVDQILANLERDPDEGVRVHAARAKARRAKR